MFLRKFIQFVVIIFLINSVSAQTTKSITLPAIQDAYVQSNTASLNYGGKKLEVGRYYKTPEYYTLRSFLKFDLSSIPSNAIIISSALKLYQTGSEKTSDNNIGICRVQNSWTETGIKWALQASFDFESPVNFTTIPSGSTGILESTLLSSQIQKMVAGNYVNNGWMLRLLNTEALNKNNNRSLVSREGAVGQQPLLTITYYTPMTVSSAIITHESAGGASDGGIVPVLKGGPGGVLTYKWYNSAGVQISSNTTTSTISGLESGWYGLEVISSVTGSIPFNYSFIVGNKKLPINISYNPGPKYLTDNSISTQSAESSFGSDKYCYAMENSTIEEVFWLLKFKLWIPDDLGIDKADLLLTMSYRTSNVSPDNSFDLFKISSDWNGAFTSYKSFLLNNGPNPYTASNPLLRIPGSNGSLNGTLNTYDAISLFNDVQISKEHNFGWISQLVNSNDLDKTVQIFSSDEADSMKRPRVNFIFKPQPAVRYEWDTLTDLGKISVDISGITDKIGPYHYLISKDSIPPLNVTYNILKDSAGLTGIDSTSFFIGNDNSLTHKFENLLADNYHIAVFDSRGIRVLHQIMGVYPSISALSNSVGVEIVNKSEVKGTTSNSSAFLDLYLYDQDEGEITFNFDQSSFNNGIQYIGLFDILTDTVSALNMAFGFELDGTILTTRTSDPNLIEVNPVKLNISSNSSITLKIQNKQLFFIYDGAIVRQCELTENHDFKVGLGLNKNSKIAVKLFGKVSKRLYRVKSNILNYPSCGNNTAGSFSFTVSFPKKDYVTYEITSTAIPTVNLNGYVQFTNPTIPALSGLSPGVYTITIKDPTTGVIIESHFVYLGYKVEWADIQNYDLITNSVTRNDDNLVFGTAGHARSVNLLPSGQNGWVKFSPKVTQIQNWICVDMLRFSVLNPTVNSILSNNPEPSRVDFYNFSTSSFNFSTAMLRDGAGNTYNTPVNSLFFDNPLNSYLIRFEASDVKFTQLIYPANQGVNWMSGARPSGITRIRANTFNEDDGFYNVISSFGCPDVSNQFAILKYELDGYYHTMRNGNIKFLVDQEYTSSNLKFKIYNDKDILIKTQVHYPAVSLVNGKNYVNIDITTELGCLGGKGYYYLEVTNEKNEKMYLRFYSDYNACYAIVDPDKTPN